MSEFARHMIGVLSAGVLGLAVVLAALAAMFAWFNAIADGDEGAIFVAIIAALLLLVAGAAWGLQ